MQREENGSRIMKKLIFIKIYVLRWLKILHVLFRLYKRMCIRGQDSCVVCVQFAVYQVIVLGMHRSLLHMHIALRQVADARQGSTFAQQSTPYRFRCFHSWNTSFIENKIISLYENHPFPWKTSTSIIIKRLHDDIPISKLSRFDF